MRKVLPTSWRELISTAWTDTTEEISREIDGLLHTPNTTAGRQVRSAALIAAAVSLGPLTHPDAVTSRADTFVNYIVTGRR